MGYRRQTPYPPALIRRALDDMANEGIPSADIGRLIDVKIATIVSWANVGGIKVGLPATDEKLDAAVDACVNSRRNKLMASGEGLPDTPMSTRFRDLTAVQDEYVVCGFLDTRAAPRVHTDEENAAFAGIITCVDRQIAHLEASSKNSENLQEITVAITAALGLKQLKEAYLNPPRVDSWRDVKLLVDMTRDALDMNRKQVNDKGGSRGVNVTILGMSPNNVKLVKPVELDAEILESEIKG